MERIRQRQSSDLPEAPPQSELILMISNIEQKYQAKVEQLQQQLEAKQSQLEEFAKRLEQADEILKYFDPAFSYRKSFKCKDEETARYICALANSWNLDPDDLVTENLKNLKDARLITWHTRVAIKGH